MDDDAAVRDLLALVLRSAACDVVAAADGAQGLGVVERLRPALVILVWLMPHVDGARFLKELRWRRLRPEIPVLVLTVDDRVRHRVTQLGAQGYHAKPFDPPVLLDQVDRLLAGTERPAAVRAPGRGWLRTGRGPPPARP